MRLVNELDAIKNKTHKTGGKKMATGFSVMDALNKNSNHQDLQTAVL